MYLELSFRPTVQLITVVRRSVMSLYEHELGSSDASARIGIATHEMLENVLRHSSGGETTLQIRTESLEDTSADKVVVIETRNRAKTDTIEALKAHAAAMTKMGPQAYYLQVITESIGHEEDGGLGLARIRAEAEMSVNIETDGDVVRVIATTKFPRGLGAAA